MTLTEEVTDLVCDNAIDGETAIAERGGKLWLAPERVSLEMKARLSSVLERAAGLGLFAACAPVIAASAFSIAVLSQRSPFVAHLRVGRFGTPLWVFKLRTMWSDQKRDPSERGWIQWIVAEPDVDRKDPHDERVTSSLAAFCRKHSIDELPQLWHVAKGEMSLVGPRPLTKSELVRHYGHLAEYVLSVRPGLTGLWQTQGRSTLDWPERVALDLAIARRPTLREYIAIVLRTIPALISGNGAW